MIMKNLLFFPLSLALFAVFFRKKAKKIREAKSRYVLRYNNDAFIIVNAATKLLYTAPFIYSISFSLSLL